jgi:hypothetical protein
MAERNWCRQRKAMRAPTNGPPLANCSIQHPRAAIRTGDWSRFAWRRLPHGIHLDAGLIREPPKGIII